MESAMRLKASMCGQQRDSILQGLGGWGRLNVDRRLGERATKAHLRHKHQNQLAANLGVYQDAFARIAPMLTNQRHRAVARENDFKGIQHHPPSYGRLLESERSAAVPARRSWTRMHHCVWRNEASRMPGVRPARVKNSFPDGIFSARPESDAVSGL
jgi:hypothetical protein